VAAGVLGPPSGAAAQPLPVVFDHLTVEDGLSQSTVTAIAQDPEGFIWLGTDDGLNRYDGYAYAVFRHQSADSTSLPHSSVEDVLVDRAGRLWVATYGGGLARFDAEAETFRAFAPGPTPAARRVLGLFEGPDGALWLGTEGAGLFRFDSEAEAFRAYPQTDGMSVRAIAADRAGRLWLGTHSGLLRFDPRAETFALWPGIPEDDAVSDVLVDAEGALWAAVRTSLLRLDPATEEAATYRLDEANPTTLAPTVTELLQGPGRHVWVGTDGGGLLRFDPDAGVFAPVTQRPGSAFGLTSGRVRTLFEDGSGLLWVGMQSDGVNKQRAVPFAAHLHRPDAPATTPPPDVAAMSEDGQGRLWIGSFESGVTRFDPSEGRFTHYTRASSGLPTDAARAVLVDAAERVWVGTKDHGAGRLDPETGAFEPVPRLRPDGRAAPLGPVISFHLDRSGALWAATYRSGPCRYDEDAAGFACLLDRWPELALSNTNTYAVFLARDGRLWASAWGDGVDVIDLTTGRVTSYRHDDEQPASLSHNGVLHIGEARDGALYLGTYGGGLNRFEPERGTFAHLTRGDGLPSNVVYGTLEDGSGALWMSTNRGLVRYEPATGTLAAFSAQAGLQGDEFNGHSLARLRSGAMAFGGLNGFNLFDPAAVRTRTFAPPVALTDVQVMGRSYPFRAAAQAGIPLRLSHRQSFVTFEFAALDFNVPAGSRYAYRLTGHDEQWIDNGDRRYATYSHLDPGRYVLHVRGTNSDGVWSPHEARLALVIVPPFWQTLWFRLATGVLLLAALIAAVRTVATRRLRRQMRALEAERRVQAERERISRDLHDHVGAQLSAMLSGIELVHLAAGSDEPERASKHLAMVQEDAQHTMTQLRETIWALQQEAITVAELARRVQEFADRHTRYRDDLAVTCSVQQAGGIELSSAQALHLFRIAQEAITNALKHANATALRISLEQAAGRALHLQIADDGVGLEGGPAHGYGLRNMRHRAEDLGGRLEVRALAPRGTEVRVTIPLNERA